MMFDSELLKAYVVEEARISHDREEEDVLCSYHWTGSNDRDVAIILMYCLMFKLLRWGYNLRTVEPYIVADSSSRRIVLKVAYRKWEQLPWNLSIRRVKNAWSSCEEFPWVDRFINGGLSDV